MRTRTAGYMAFACGMFAVAAALYYAVLMVAIDYARFPDMEAYGLAPDYRSGLAVAFVTIIAGCVSMIAAVKRSSSLALWIATAITMSLFLMAFIPPGPLSWSMPGDQFTLKDYLIAWSPGSVPALAGMIALFFEWRRRADAKQS